MEVNTIAIDLAKNVFALCAANAAGELIWRKELRRAQMLSFMHKQRPCVVGMKLAEARTTGLASSPRWVMRFVW